MPKWVPRAFDMLAAPLLAITLTPSRSKQRVAGRQVWVQANTSTPDRAKVSAFSLAAAFFPAMVLGSGYAISARIIELPVVVQEFEAVVA